VSTLVHATVYMFLHNLLHGLVLIANKMGLQKKISYNMATFITTAVRTSNPISESASELYRPSDRRLSAK
jgi:hypothetical protein